MSKKNVCDKKFKEVSYSPKCTYKLIREFTGTKIKMMKILNQY